MNRDQIKFAFQGFTEATLILSLYPGLKPYLEAISRC
jgi:hypothetical protein